MAYLHEQRQDFGLTESDIADVIINDDHVSRHTGIHHVYLLQRFEGIEIKNRILNLAIDADGNVVHVGNRFLSHLAHRASGTARLSALEALDHAAAALELDAPTGVQVLKAASVNDQSSLLNGAGISLENIPVKLVYQPVAGGSLRLAWDLEIHQLDQTHWWSIRVDAETGRMLNKTDYVVRESYEVIPLPFESAHHAPVPPPADGRMIEIDPFLDSPASPFGWHDTDGVAGPEFTITRGNNTHAYADTDNDGVPDGGANAEPDGGVSLDFTDATVPIDFTMAPSTYTQASIANLFYWSNVTHDVLWGYGFDEASGNFQVNNYGNGGLGNDDVRSEAQNGFVCNATFGTPADGQRPLMSMFVCNNAAPGRDGTFDHGVVIHEYGHGVSSRLTGGPSEAGCLNTLEQMGEGWSDYLGLILTQEPGDAGPDARGVGTYLFGQGPDGPGIRNAPYSTDFAVNNFTYGNISGVSIPHGVGHVWATMLWDMSWNLIDEYGFNSDIYQDWTTGGNNLALQLVMDGMKFQPCGPGFVDGRDAILAADDAVTGAGGFFTGANQCLIWDAFATRGLGFNADQGDPNNVNDGVENFDMPASCETIGAPIGVQNICQGDTASFRIGVGDMFTSPPVAMSVTGEPGGTTATFDPTMVATVPGTSDLDITNTGSAAAGNYNLMVNGTDGVNSFDTTVQLNVFDTSPTAGPELVKPMDEATDEPIVGQFKWSSVSDALSYTIEVDEDPSFGSIDYTASGIESLTHRATVALDFLTKYYWRVRGDNSCGSGSYSSARTFTTHKIPEVCADKSLNRDELSHETYADEIQLAELLTKFTLPTNADLEITTKSTDHQDLGKLGPLGICVEVRNNGPAPAHNTVVWSTLDRRARFEATVGCPNRDPTGHPICNLGTIENEETVDYCIIFSVDDTDSAWQAGSVVNQTPNGDDCATTTTSNITLVNRFRVSSDTPDNDLTNNKSTTTTTIGSEFIFSDGFESGDTSAWDNATP